MNKSNVVNLTQVRIQQKKIKAKQQAQPKQIEQVGLLNKLFRKIKSIFSRK